MYSESISGVMLRMQKTNISEWAICTESTKYEEIPQSMCGFSEQKDYGFDSYVQTVQC